MCVAWLNNTFSVDLCAQTHTVFAMVKMLVGWPPLRDFKSVDNQDSRFALLELTSASNKATRIQRLYAMVNFCA